MSAPRTLGGYRILRHLATGGMAEVYVAESAVGRQVVLKRIKPKLAQDPSYVDLFLREATISLRVSHPRIAQVFDFGEAEGTFFLVMEYVEGRSLSEVEALCAERGLRMPRPLATSVVADVAGALDHVHHLVGEDGRPLGIVHRDVSPQNVMVALDGQVKLVDFGVARSPLLKEVTQAGVTRGKYRYFAPEQLRRGTVDARTDVYACGVLLYELLTGRLPFDGELYAVLEAIVHGRYAPPRELDPSIPRSLEALVTWAMAKDPGDRPQRAGELETELTRWLRLEAPAQTEGDLATFVAGLSSTAPPAPVRRRLWLPALLGGAAALTALAVGYMLSISPDPEASQRVEEALRLREIAPPPPEAPELPPAQLAQIKEARSAAVRDVTWHREEGTGHYLGTLPVEKILIDPESLAWAGQALPAGRITARVTGKVTLKMTEAREVLFRTRGCPTGVGILRPGDDLDLTGCTWVGFLVGDPFSCTNNSDAMLVTLHQDGKRHTSIPVDGRRNCLDGEALDALVPGAGFVQDGFFNHYLLEVDLAGLEGAAPPYLAFLVERPPMNVNAGQAVGFVDVYTAEDVGKAVVLPSALGLRAFIFTGPTPPSGVVRARLRRHRVRPGTGRTEGDGRIDVPDRPW